MFFFNRVLSCSYNHSSVTLLSSSVIPELLPIKVKATWGQVWGIGWMQQFLKSTFSQSRLCNYFLVGRCIVVKLNHRRCHYTESNPIDDHSNISSKKLQKQNFKPLGHYTCMQCGTSHLQTVQENILSHIILAT